MAYDICFLPISHLVGFCMCCQNRSICVVKIEAEELDYSKKMDSIGEEAITI